MQNEFSTVEDALTQLKKVGKTRETWLHSATVSMPRPFMKC